MGEACAGRDIRRLSRYSKIANYPTRSFELLDDANEAWRRVALMWTRSGPTSLVPSQATLARPLYFWKSRGASSSPGLLEYCPPRYAYTHSKDSASTRFGSRFWDALRRLSPRKNIDGSASQLFKKSISSAVKSGW